jgi:uncharacterized damage-inducible protein DinB
MDVEAQGLLAELSNIHQRTKAAVEKLGDDGVNWRPSAPDSNPASVIVSHMCGSEAAWVGEYVGGVPAHRVRTTEFQSPQKTVKGLVALVNRLEASSQAAISKHTSASLNKLAVTGRPEFKGTLRDCVLHALTHEAEHVGHLELTLQLWLARGK